MNICCTLPIRKTTRYLSARLFPIFVIMTLLSSSAFAQQCADGLDNDNDNRVDALKLVPLEDTKVFSSNYELVIFVNSFPQWDDLSTRSSDRGTLRSDPITRQRICELAGYSNVVSYITTSWGSCRDNTVGYWDEASQEFIITNACRFNYNITSLVCDTPLSQCSDGIDNDGDGAIDGNDSGCFNSRDDDERPHDPDCKSPLDNDESPPAQCDDGADNDQDGGIDALAIQSAASFNVQRTFGLRDGSPSAQHLADLVAQQIRLKGLDFDQPIYPLVRMSAATGANGIWNDNGQLDSQTLNKVCEILGYEHYVSSTYYDGDVSAQYPNGKGNFTRGNNGLIRFDGTNFVGVATREPAPYYYNWISSITCSAPIPECRDGIDNDGDNKIDRQDLGCSSADDLSEHIHDSSCNGLDDDSEFNACQDGVDNDSDGTTDYPADFACDSPQDDNEGDRLAQCQDGTDNDADGLADLNDPGCSSAQDNDESDATSQCQDGVDNDEDNLIDGFDPGCENSQDNDESNGTSQCQDGIDNDGDLLIDFGQDPDCSSKEDDNESPENKYYVCELAENFDDGNSDQISLIPFGSSGELCSNQVVNGKLQVNCPEFAGYRIVLNDSSSHSSADVSFSAEITNRNWKSSRGASMGLTQISLDKGFHINFFAPHEPAGTNKTSAANLILFNGINNTVYAKNGANVGEGFHQYFGRISGSQSLTKGTSLSVAQDDAIFGLIDGGHLGNPGWALGVSVAEADYLVDNIKARIVARAPIPCAPEATQCSDEIDNDQDGLVDSSDPGCWAIPNDPNSYEPTDNDESDGTTQCQDELDNDNDGVIDALDPGCWSDLANANSYDRTDNDEGNATTQCQDSVDNDSDAVIDASDPGCWTDKADVSTYDRADNDESDGTTQCQDNVDNDADGSIDLEDFSCGGDNTKNDESTPLSQCQDELDNDNDGLIDLADPGCATPQGNNEGSLTSQCQDGTDNDGDGATDLMDYSCLGDPTNDDESNPQSQCQDGIDNDEDKLVDLTDPGCDGPQDNYEGDATSECQDGIDNDGDGAVDMDDFSCQGDNTKDDESNPQSQCQDAIDNDGDQVTDLDDPGCESNQDNNEGDGTTACQDTFDNDRDGVADDQDPGCWTDSNDPNSYEPTDRDESDATTQCQDGIDNDSDGAIDHPNDFACGSLQDNDEDDLQAECQDEKDNDNDGRIDLQDPGCSSSQDNDENGEPQCNDTVDNDSDGLIDTKDPGCSSVEDDDESDATSQCQDTIDNDADSLIDSHDPGCRIDPNDPNSYDPTDNSEEDNMDKSCADKIDNDNDGLIDQKDPDCWTDHEDPNSYDPASPNGEDTPQFGSCSNETELTPLREATLPIGSDNLSLTGIRIFESSGEVAEYDFDPSDARLTVNDDQNERVNDFTTSEAEYYDVFISDADGTLNPNGSYLTIEALADSSDGMAHNIDAVHLLFGESNQRPADLVSKVVLGDNLSPDILLTNGFAKLAVGVKDETTTILGDGQTALTLGFCDTLSTPPCNSEQSIEIKEVTVATTDDLNKIISDSVQRLRRQVKPVQNQIGAGRSVKLQRFIKTAQASLKKNLANAGVLNEQVPEFINSCGIGTNCATINNVTAKLEMLEKANRLLRTARKAVTREFFFYYKENTEPRWSDRTKADKQKLYSQYVNRKKLGKNLYNNLLTIIATIPDETRLCE